jgi:hypothetical protein
MNSETLLLGFAFLWGLLILYRIHKRRSSKANPTGGLKVIAPSTQREMPRIGANATITFNQTLALRRNNFSPDKNWSREEAALILDGVKYLRCVCRDLAEEENDSPPVEVLNEILRFILTSDDIREHIRKWGEQRRAEGLEDYADDEPELPRNQQYERVATEARKYFKSDGKETEDSSRESV